MDDLKDELGAAYKRMMEANYPVTTIGGGCSDADGTLVTVSSVEWANRADRLNITLSNGNSCTNRNPSSIHVNGGQTLYDVSRASNDGATLKASWNWNWNMMNEDETINTASCDTEEDPECTVRPHTDRGVHNPDLSIRGMTGAIAAVQAVAP
jgi:hypothetical protein